MADAALQAYGLCRAVDFEEFLPGSGLSVSIGIQLAPLFGVRQGPFWRDTSVCARTLAMISPISGIVCSRRDVSSETAARRRSAVMASVRAFASVGHPFHHWRFACHNRRSAKTETRARDRGRPMGEIRIGPCPRINMVYIHILTLRLLIHCMITTPDGPLGTCRSS